MLENKDNQDDMGIGNEKTLGMDYVRLGLAIDNTGKVNYMNGTVNYWDMACKSKWYGENGIDQSL